MQLSLRDQCTSYKVLRLPATACTTWHRLMRKICWATFRSTVYLAAESWPNDTKSMLNSTAHFSALNLSSVVRVDLSIAGCNRFSPVCSVGATATDRSLTLRGPRHSHLQAASKLQHRTVCASTSAAYGRAHVGSLKASPLRRQIHLSSMQTQQTPAAQREEVKTLRAHQQGAGTAEATLPQAEVALHPFLTCTSEQPAREQVDYSRGQRPLQIIDPEVEMINPADWDVVCDVRTPDEFEEDRILGAVNTPVLSNEQRAQIGTIYKQTGQHEAKRLGAALISRNIADILLNHFQEHGKQLKVLVYCWRGGERSQSLAHVLSRVGWQVAIIRRGYMGYRNQVRRCMEVLGRFQYHVIGGATGSGKGKLLDCLREHGGQVVDLEVAADHRGSILGDHPTRLQPPQKMFESKLLHQMRNFSVDRPVFIESESSLVGRRQVPAAMWKAMQAAAQVTELEVPLHSRVAWLRHNYSYFEDEHKDVLMRKLDALTKTSGKKVVSKWRELAEQSKWDDFVAAMLHEHYDVVYARAQLKYLTPSSSQAKANQPANASNHSTAETTDGESSDECHQENGVGSQEVDNNHTSQSASSSLTVDHDAAEQDITSADDATVEAAGALSHLFGGPRQKLMQQVNSKQAESTLRWHRAPVDDISDEIYSALALKLLKEYDPAALQTL